MAKRCRTTIIWSLLLIGFLALSGCMKTGSDEIVPTKGNEEKTTGAEEAGGDKKENKLYELVLTEEEANKDHLTAKLSELVEIDAYITPYENYKNGVGQYHMNMQNEAETYRLFSQIDLNETVLNTVTFSKFIDVMDKMAETMGPVYQKAWEETKGVDNRDFLEFQNIFAIRIQTRGSSVDGGGYNGLVSDLLIEETENLSFMRRETAIDAVQNAVNELLPNVSENFSIHAQDRQSLESYLSCQPDGYLARTEWLKQPECYRLEFTQTIEGIPITYNHAPCRIKAGDMSPESMWYNEKYEKESYSIGASTGLPAAVVEISENGFWFYIYAKYSFTPYREAQPVIGINEVIKKSGELLHKKNCAVKVKQIELGMGDKVAGEEGEKKRIVLSPYWAVHYYAEKTENGKKVMKHRILNIDAYSGEIVYDGEL